MYTKNDIVLVKSMAGSAIPNVHVKLIKKHVVKEKQGNKITWPAYVGWDAKLIYKNEVLKLKKRFCIPYEFPNKVTTFVFEDDIISKVN